jgi:hypothetical protein
MDIDKRSHEQIHPNALDSERYLESKVEPIIKGNP